MKRRILICCSVLLVVVATLPLLLAQGSQGFSADMKITGKGVSSTGKLYAAGEKARMEMTMMGHTSITISDQAKKMAYVLMPDQKMYMQMSTEGVQKQQKGPSFRNYNPANPCENVPDVTCQKIGPEMMNGQMCTKWSFIHKNAKENLTVWIDQKTGIPVKSQTADGSTMELSNVKMGAQPASLFEVPPGYQKFDMGGMMKGLGKMQMRQE